jgi:hypothetical protein
MGQITDAITGELRPYDPDLDYDVPAYLFGPLPFDPSGPLEVAPLRPERDLLAASAKTHGGDA